MCVLQSVGIPLQLTLNGRKHLVYRSLQKNTCSFFEKTSYSVNSLYNVAIRTDFLQFAAILLLRAYECVVYREPCRQNVHLALRLLQSSKIERNFK